MALLLLVGPRYAYAQAENTGAAPYRDSQHSYRVPIGLVANDQRWVVTDDGANTFNLTSSPEAWATITPATLDGGYEVIEIFFDRNVFSVGTWYLRFYEDQDMGGSIICVSAREFVITISENSFRLTLAATVPSQCNSQSGIIHAYTELDEPTEVFTTNVTYIVNMNKSNDFNPTSYNFDANFSQSISVISATTNDSAIIITGATPGTDFNIEVKRAVANAASDVVEITVTYSNPVLADVTRNLTVTNGEAIVSKPLAPDAVTEDNIVGYPGRVQAITILAVPATRDIAYGEGETAATAQNPLRYSTHKYVVQMEDIARWNQGSSGWYIETASGASVTAGVTTFSIESHTQSATSDTVAIRFYFDPLVEDEYILYFTEDNANGCSSVRPYPITIQPPFDVDLATITPICAAISGSVNNLTQTDKDNGVPVHETTTTVDYQINLNTTDYFNDWHFTFGVSGAPVFDPASIPVSDLEVESITIESAGLSENAGIYTVTNSQASPVIQAVIRVTYNGVYQNEHIITATLGGITGSYIESDADVTNNITHTIYAMPQPGALAGVD